ncbi:DUF6660 family protein [Sphingobacterium faecium]|uniref:DUF6660 family protein n=1 Tax=Sphingobacterium faecium TaxID=34087 RepID=UPI003D9C9AA6
MKILVYILSLYFIALTLIPCADQVQVFSYGQETGARHVNHEDLNHTDNCSPFCICSCCSIVLNIEPITAISFVVIFLHSKGEIAYENNFYSFNDSSIWQPPQLV